MDLFSDTAAILIHIAIVGCLEGKYIPIFWPWLFEIQDGHSIAEKVHWKLIAIFCHSHGQVHHRVEKSHSEPVIPPSDDQPKPAKKPHSGHVHSREGETRKLSVQSSASAGGGSERKPRRTSRTHQGASLNEVRCKKSKRVFTKINDGKLCPFS